MRRSIQSGAWILEVPDGAIEARTQFQRERLTKAVTAARLYLGGDVLARQIGGTLGVTEERASQVVRTGISFMQRAGWLRPALPPEPESASRSLPPPSGDRARGLCSPLPSSKGSPSGPESRER